MLEKHYRNLNWALIQVPKDDQDNLATDEDLLPLYQTPSRHRANYLKLVFSSLVHPLGMVPFDRTSPTATSDLLGKYIFW